MRQFIGIFLFILTVETYAAKAVVIVLEAPLLRYETLNSKVLQTIRKGEEVYIHNKDIDTSPYSVEYNVDDDGNPMATADITEKEGFYKTLTRDGKDAFIPKKYVKLLYNDSRELIAGRKSYKHDPTDYRLEEPLPKNYPLYITDHKRALILAGIGPGTQTGYSYPDKIKAEQISSRYGANIIYTGSVNFDTSNRFYFGTMFHVFNQQSDYLTESDCLATESHSEFGLGPYISYDISRGKRYRLTLAGGITLNYHRYLIEQKEDTGGFEQRIFKGFSFASSISTNYTYKSFIPGTELDLVLGIEAQINLPYSLTSNTEISNEDYWSADNDDVRFSLNGQYALYLGIQSNY